MVQEETITRDSFGESINHKLDYMIGNREHGQLVQIGRANQAIPVTYPLLTPFFDSSVTSTAEIMVGVTAVLYYLEVQNPNAVDAWLQLFDAASPTVGTTTPTLSVFVPALGATDKFWPGGIRFRVAIRYAATTTSTGNTAPSSNLVVNGGYV